MLQFLELICANLNSANCATASGHSLEAYPRPSVAVGVALAVDVTLAAPANFGYPYGRASNESSSACTGNHAGVARSSALVSSRSRRSRSRRLRSDSDNRSA